jgi:hypothetical protein
VLDPGDCGDAADGAAATWVAWGVDPWMMYPCTTSYLVQWLPALAREGGVTTASTQTAVKATDRRPWPKCRDIMTRFPSILIA